MFSKTKSPVILEEYSWSRTVEMFCSCIFHFSLPPAPPHPSSLDVTFKKCLSAVFVLPTNYGKRNMLLLYHSWYSKTRQWPQIQAPIMVPCVWRDCLKLGHCNAELNTVNLINNVTNKIRKKIIFISLSWAIFVHLVHLHVTFLVVKLAFKLFTGAFLLWTCMEQSQRAGFRFGTKSAAAG